MSKLEKLKDKARALETKDPRGAIEAWREVLLAEDEDGEPNPDLAIFNRIGDLCLKVKDPASAADFYDRAVDKYAELGFHNNAIAMCNKVLRNAPGRPNTYLKLAKLYAAKGFMAEAKQNFVEYADRMQKAGNIQHAFAALKEFTDIAPEAEHLRGMLMEHLQMYGVAETPARTTGPGQRLSTGTMLPPDVPKSPKRKTSSLVFLDLNEPSAPKKAAGKPGAPARPAPPPAAAPPVAAQRVLPPEPEAEPEDLEIETTAIAEPEEAAADTGGMLDGLEITSEDFGQVRRAAPEVPSIRQEARADNVVPIPGLEPTAAQKGTVDGLPLLDGEIQEVEEAPAEPVPVPEPPRPSRRKPVVELPPLDLESDFEAVTTEEEHEVDEEPLVMEEPPAARADRKLSLGVEGVINQAESPGALLFDDLEVTPEAASIEDLEGRVADNPDDPEAHHALGEALIEAGERERGLEELDLAVGGFESTGDFSQAEALVDEILRLDPNSVRHRQKVVEFAFKSGDKAQLIGAYLELADTLLRSDLADKARAVYERVVEHDPKNGRARAALAMLAPAPATGPEKKVAAKDAKMTVRDEAGVGGDFVDLGAMILEEDLHERDSRMRVEDEEPTGDEQKDFEEMLARFRQGIDENIDEADFQSHYDLGVAFKEMGLLDEAIAEFQKALRAPEGKLRTSEALGICFFEKGAYGVAESILRRGLELPATGDQERLGVLYWLARALEEQGRGADARDLYGRVFAVDIRFMDVGERVKALTRAR